MYTQQQQNLFVVFTSVLIVVSVLFLGGCSSSSDSSDNATSPASGTITALDIVGTWGLMMTANTVKATKDYDEYTRIMVLDGQGNKATLMLPDGSDQYSGSWSYNQSTGELIVEATGPVAVSTLNFAGAVRFEGTVSRDPNGDLSVTNGFFSTGGLSGSWDGLRLSA